jgi:hypothetical protein
VAQSVVFRPDPWGLAPAARQLSAIRQYYGLAVEVKSPILPQSRVRVNNPSHIIQPEQAVHRVAEVVEVRN